MFRILYNLLRKRARQEDFVVLTARVAYGVSAEAGFAIRDALNSQHPDGWWFLNPGTFQAYFLSTRSGAARAQECRIALELLRGRDHSLRELTLVQAEGTLLARFDWRGRPTSMPMGTTTESRRGPSLPESSSQGRPLCLDRTAASGDPNLPAFLARPAGSPAYHGFPLIEETRTDGWAYGAITDVPDPADGTAGDGYVVAPDGARAGLAWSVGAYPTKRICPPDVDRWGVFAVAFPRRVRTMDDLVYCFRHVLPELRGLYAQHLAGGTGHS